MRSIWSGAISFGLVNIPVNLYSAVEKQSGLDFDMLDKETHSPIHYKRIRESDNKEVEYKNIVKGYEYSKGEYIIISEKDFENASPEKSQNIEISRFVNSDEIDSVFFDKPYFLEPVKNAAKPYVLLREALIKSKKVGIAHFVLRNREHLAIVKPMNEVLVLNLIRYSSELRDSKQLNIPGDVKVAAEETKMAIKLIEELTEKFDPEKFRDTYSDQLKEIIAAKLEGKAIHKKSAKKEPTKVKDLMEVLKESLEASKKSKSKRELVAG